MHAGVDFQDFYSIVSNVLPAAIPPGRPEFPVVFESARYAATKQDNHQSAGKNVSPTRRCIGEMIIRINK